MTNGTISSFHEGSKPGDRLLPEVDQSVPSVARVYDYALNGKDNYEVDRRVYRELEAAFPGVTQLAVDNRRFLQRAVRYLVADAGVRQIIDVGSGLPSAGNVHEIAHQIAPETRVVYVDNDPIVLAHGRALLTKDEHTTVIRADATDPASILNHSETRRLIDFAEPFAVLFIGLLHWLSDEQDPAAVTRAFKGAMSPGSFLAASVLLDDDGDVSVTGERRAADVQQKLTDQLGVGWFRPWSEHRRYFEGLDMVPPGLVYANDWRPDEATEVDGQWHAFLTGGIGRKPS